MSQFNTVKRQLTEIISAAEHLAIEQDLIEMQDLDNDLDGINHQTEIEVDDNIKSEPNGETKSHNSSEIEEVKNSPTKSLTEDDYLQTKNGPVRASILPVSSSQVPIS